MNTRVNEIYSEVYSILNLLGDNYISRLPKKLYEIIENKRDFDYQPKYSFEVTLDKQDLRKESISMIALFQLKYWCNSEEEKRNLQKIFSDNEIEKEKKLKEKYSVNKIFDEKKIIIQKEEKKVDIVVYKENVFTKIKKFFLNIFKINL